ncbi:MAG TPA: hypothetical protein VE133_14575 [Candidatus Sulfotelmatobacter sp.]|nr:hypothetical protein [Candidatus Sulfotelmatobacter sp.]
MLKKKQNKPEISRKIDGSPLASNVGVILLELHRALRTAERCRVTLRELGYSQKCWQEIVKDVNPELRFMLRPQILDDIITHLQSVGKPMDRTALAHRLNLQGAGQLMRIKQTITANLRSGNLKRFGENKIGLPAWTNRESEAR